MSQRTEVLLIDDRDGGPAHEAGIQFGLDGVNYKIDLSDENAAALRGVIGDWAHFARREGKRPRPPKRVPAPRDDRSIRAWAREHGIDIGARGRVPAEVMAAYREEYPS